MYRLPLSCDRLCHSFRPRLALERWDQHNAGPMLCTLRGCRLNKLESLSISNTATDALICVENNKRGLSVNGSRRERMPARSTIT
jgi:hypothetical protein